MERLKTLTTNLCRFVLAATFILSGFVKAVDPMGTAYKINDYLAVMQWQQYVPEALMVMVAMLLAACEFGLGISMLFAIRRRATAHFVFLLLSVMTPLTLWLAIDNPVRDCGCFGDAFLLTNWQTFGKNAVLWLLAATVVRWPTRMPRFIGEGNQWIVVNYSAVFILAVASYGLYFLPLFDFRPYHVGVHIPEAMTIPEGAPQPKFETTFILAKDGVQKEFTIDNYPDSTWTFVDSTTVETEKGYEQAIHDFAICTMEDGEDITLDVLNRPGYTFLLIAPHLRKADDSRLDLINLIYEYAEEQRVPFYCLTASGEEEVARWKENTGAEYLFCHTDETTLKTIIRSNPGLMLLKNGVVYRKWSCNNLPAEEQLGQTLATAAIGQMESDSTAAKIFQIVVWYVLPLLLLTIADRLWAWTRWLRRKKTSNRIYQLFKKKKKMRKKIVAGNWKMNMNLQEGVALAKELNETLTAEKPNCGVVICTPFIHLASIAQFLNQDVIGLGAENCADKEKGAYTGEVSAEMVKSTGAQYVILGHSERRGYYGETPEILKEKVLLALKNGLKVIFCIGESLEEREANKQNEVCKAELEGSVFNLTAEEFKNIIIAYEPIWAIGTGKTATAEQAEEIHAYIRSTVAEKYGNEVAEETTILYGGSCKASNAPELFAKPDIDGGLIGGASLKAADFKGIIDAWKK